MDLIKTDDVSAFGNGMKQGQLSSCSHLDYQKSEHVQKYLFIVRTLVYDLNMFGNALGQSNIPWMMMSAISVGLYAILKCLTFLNAASKSASFKHPMIYCFAWVGLDPVPFRDGPSTELKPESGILFSGLINTVLGLALIASIKQVNADLWLLRGWLFCIGLCLTLHFGIFKMLAWAIRKLGFDVEPIMKNPLASIRIAEFWGERWNQAFKQFVSPFIFRPIQKRFGNALAVWAVFLFSGFVHEIAISVPAGAGFGLPTLYFLLQPLGMKFERSVYYQTLSPALQRAFTWLVVGAPAIILFHPPFMKTVISPLERALGG